MTAVLRNIGNGAVPGNAPSIRDALGFEALIFDVDGTLADTEELHREAFNEAFHAHSLDWSWTPELYRELLLVSGGKERIASYIERLGLESSERQRLLRLIPEIHSTKTRVYKELMDLGRARPRTGMIRLMSEARLVGIRLAIASTTSPENVVALINASFGSEAMHWFSAIVTGDVVARKKPAPDIYALALATLRLPPQRAIAFEDSENGVRAAKAAGVFTVATPTVWTEGQDFTAADLVLQSLADPEEPLRPADEWRVGAKFLGLEQLATFHMFHTAAK